MMKTTVKSLEGSRQKLFIDGRFVTPKSGNHIESFDPTTGESWYHLAEADAADVDAAVAAASAAFRNPAWRRMTQTDRGRLVRRLADLALAHADELAAIETRDNGKLIKEMRAQMRAMPDSYHYFAGMADKLQGETIPVNKLDMLNFNMREPLRLRGKVIWTTETEYATKANPAGMGIEFQYDPGEREEKEAAVEKLMALELGEHLVEKLLGRKPQG